MKHDCGVRVDTKALLLRARKALADAYSMTSRNRAGRLERPAYVNDAEHAEALTTIAAIDSAITDGVDPSRQIDGEKHGD